MARRSSNWIRKSKRYAIYRRDEMRCVYCGIGVAAGEHVSNPRAATLDHVRPVDLGGCNAASNLVTCCAACNIAKSNLAMAVWVRTLAEAVAEDDDELADEIAAVKARVRDHSRRDWRQHKES